MRKSSTTQRRKQLVSMMVVGILILVLAVAGIGIHIISKYIPSKEQMNLTEYYGQPAEKMWRSWIFNMHMMTARLPGKSQKRC